MASKRGHVEISRLFSDPSESKRRWSGHAIRNHRYYKTFPPGLYLGPQELRCYNIDKLDPTGEARID